jgi:hypothetical protein
MHCATHHPCMAGWEPAWIVRAEHVVWHAFTFVNFHYQSEYLNGLSILTVNFCIPIKASTSALAMPWLAKIRSRKQKLSPVDRRSKFSQHLFFHRETVGKPVIRSTDDFLCYRLLSYCSQTALVSAQSVSEKEHIFWISTQQKCRGAEDTLQGLVSIEID